jgi:hypothetical protein
LADSGSQSQRRKSAQRRSGTAKRSRASTKAGDRHGNGNGNGGNDNGKNKNDSPASVINLASAGIGALTAAATLIVVPGSIALYLRLHHQGLPSDLGVVASLPAQFLIATGVTYVLFPLLVIVTAAVVVVLVPGDHGQTNSLVRHPSQWRKGWHKGWRWSTVGVVAFLVFGTIALSLAIDGGWPRWWVVLVDFLGLLICLIANNPVAENWKKNPDALPAIILSATIAGLLFTPWAIWFAFQRGHFPNATVCTSHGEHFEGPFIGETSDRVYVGEPAIRVLAVVPPRTAAALRARLRLDRYAVRFASKVRKRRLLETDFAIIDFDLIRPSKAPAGIPVLGLFHKLSQPNRQAIHNTDFPKNDVLLQRDLDDNPEQLVDAFKARAQVAAKRDLTIASIPTSQVERILIGGRGSCPPAPRTGAAGSS